MPAVQIRPPFSKQNPQNAINGGVIGTSNVIWRNGVPYVAVGARILDQTRKAEKGLYVAGRPTGSVWVTLTANSTNRRLLMTVSDETGRACEYDMTELFGEGVPRFPACFIQNSDTLFVLGLSRIYQVDLYTLAVTKQTFSPGLEAGQTPYIDQESLPTLGACYFNGRYIYWLREASDVRLSLEPTDVQKQYGDSERLIEPALMRLSQSDLLWSDPFQPFSVQWSSMWTAVGTYGGAIQAVVPVVDGLLVLTSAGTYKLEGQDPAEAITSTISEWASCVAPRSAVSIGDSVFWLGQGIIWRYRMNGQLERAVDLNQFWTGFDERRIQNPYSDLAETVGTVIGNGSGYLLHVPHGFDIAVNLDDGYASLASEGGDWTTAFPVSRMGIGTEDEVIVGGLGGLNLLKTRKVTATGYIAFALPPTSAFLRKATVYLSSAPDSLWLEFGHLHDLMRTAEDDSCFAPEDHHFNIELPSHQIWSRLQQSGLDEYVPGHAFFDLAKFQPDSGQRDLNARYGMRIPTAFSVDVGLHLKQDNGPGFMFVGIIGDNIGFLGADLFFDGGE